MRSIVSAKNFNSSFIDYELNVTGKNMLDYLYCRFFIWKFFFKEKEANSSDKTSDEKNSEKVINQFEENKVQGLLDVKTYFDYFRVGGGYFGAITIILIFVISQFLIVSCDYWISYWYQNWKS